jgi:hypothetical protein
MRPAPASSQHTPSLESLATGLALGLALLLAGCGSGASPFPEYRPQDYPPIRTTLLSEPFSLPPGASVAFDLPPEWKGDVTATVDWTSSSNTVVAAFAARTCPGVNQALGGACTQGLQQAAPSTCAAKPRVLTAFVIGSAPVRIYVANAGPSAESGRVQVTHCEDAPDCAAGAACAQCSAERWSRDSCK